MESPYRDDPYEGAPKGVYISLILCFVFLVVVPIIGVAGVQYVYSEITGGFPCDNDSIVPLRTLLKVFPSINILFIVMCTVSFVQAAYRRSLYQGKISLACGLIFIAFIIAMNVVGCVSFFGSVTYQQCNVVNYPLWIIMWISLALGWWSILMLSIGHGVLLDFLRNE